MGMTINLGKKYMKKYIDNFIPSLFQAVVDPTSPKLLVHSASQCILQLYITIGTTIFLAHLPEGSFYHQALEKILDEKHQNQYITSSRKNTTSKSNKTNTATKHSESTFSFTTDHPSSIHQAASQVPL